MEGGVRKATARARPRACASAVRGQRVLRGERWRSLARATRARAARRSGERSGARARALDMLTAATDGFAEACKVGEGVLIRQGMAQEYWKREI